MTNEQIEFQDVLQLVELIKTSSNFSEIRLRSGAIEVELRRNGGVGLASAEPATQRPLTAASSAPSQTVPSVGVQTPPAEASSTREPTPRTTPRHVSREGMTVIKSPMVGTVYHAPEPGAAPFVKVGQSVSPGDPICIVEVMKLMNSIDAECHGVVTEILVIDGEAVEFGQELFVISNQ